MDRLTWSTSTALWNIPSLLKVMCCTLMIFHFKHFVTIVTPNFASQGLMQGQLTYYRLVLFVSDPGNSTGNHTQVFEAIAIQFTPQAVQLQTLVDIDMQSTSINIVSNMVCQDVLVNMVQLVCVNSTLAWSFNHWVFHCNKGNKQNTPATVVTCCNITKTSLYTKPNIFWCQAFWLGSSPTPTFRGLRSWQCVLVLSLRKMKNVCGKFQVKILGQVRGWHHQCAFSTWRDGHEAWQQALFYYVRSKVRISWRWGNGTCKFTLLLPILLTTHVLQSIAMNNKRTWKAMPGSLIQPGHLVEF